MTNSLVSYRQITKLVNGLYEVNQYFHDLKDAGFTKEEFPHEICCKIVHNMMGVNHLINFTLDQMFKLLPEINDFKTNNNNVGTQMKDLLNQLDILNKMVKEGGLTKLNIEVKALWLSPKSTVLSQAARWIGNFLEWSKFAEMDVERAENITKINFSEREITAIIAELQVIKGAK